MSTHGYADFIRTALRVSDAPLSLDDIGTGYIGDGFDHKGLSQIMSQRIRAGEFIRHHNPNGVLTYSLDPSYKLRKPHGEALQEALEKSPETAKPAAHDASLGEIPPAPMARRDRIAAPLGLLHRTEAVSIDIEDLIGDACDQQLPHALIKALVTAGGAIQRAARQMTQA